MADRGNDYFRIKSISDPLPRAIPHTVPVHAVTFVVGLVVCRLDRYPVLPTTKCMCIKEKANGVRRDGTGLGFGDDPYTAVSSAVKCICMVLTTISGNL
jgi:hypothetical protein